MNLGASLDIISSLLTLIIRFLPDLVALFAYSVDIAPDT
jgi:hypothetical protein